ncbi:hypothetical protein DM02DRAFT_613786 [Periconia macrospinosa]|uniref:Prolyl 4-hydroxylase alpha subunit domain-containing protein n=1 Tax=Periconia macrospinosa TaxID=97972 RepID=A0A2V1DSY3_9PLEO|nr:hypothetical protein DM02DRAFT_613786 [Periconia macrospinosa]
MSFHGLPSEFLTQPGPEITKSHIDWSQTTLPEYANAYAVVLDNVLTPAECAQLVSAAEASNKGEWDQAMLRSGRDSMRLATNVRKGDRIIWDNREVVDRIWKRVQPHVPELQTISNQPMVTGNRPVQFGEIWDFTALNERMRFLRYGPGEYFKEHEDGAYERPGGSERTMFTLHLYLNEADDTNPLVGGATSFHHIEMKRELDVNVTPKFGRVLIFQHKGLLHSGQEVQEGLKLTLRTDMFFAKRKEVVPQEERVKVGPRVKSKYQYWAKRERKGAGGGAAKSSGATS